MSGRWEDQERAFYGLDEMRKEFREHLYGKQEPPPSNKCGWCLSRDTEDVAEGRLRCKDCGALQLAAGVGAWHIPKREGEYQGRERASFERGAAVAFGLIGMALAIREGRFCELCDVELGDPAYRLTGKDICCYCGDAR